MPFELDMVNVFHGGYDCLEDGSLSRQAYPLIEDCRIVTI